MGTMLVMMDPSAGGLTGATGNKTVYTIPAYNYGLQTVNNNQHGNVKLQTFNTV